MKKGQAVIDMNQGAIDRGMEALVKIEVPSEWSELELVVSDDSKPEFIEKILNQ